MPLAYFILNEAMSKLKIAALAGVFFGVLILSLNKNEDQNGNHEYYGVGIILVWLSCFGSAGVGVMLRVLSLNLHPALSPIWYSISVLQSIILFLVFYPSVYNFSEYSIESWSWFLLSGILFYVGINFKSWAFKYADAKFVASFQYMRVVILSIFDIAVFHYTFNHTDMIGFAVIFVWVIAPIIAEYFQQKDIK